jgi:acyl dehydratase
VLFGDSVTMRAEVKAVDARKRFVTCATTCTNQSGTVVIDGSATILVPELDLATDAGGT